MTWPKTLYLNIFRILLLPQFCNGKPTNYNVFVLSRVFDLMLSLFPNILLPPSDVLWLFIVRLTSIWGPSLQSKVRAIVYLKTSKTGSISVAAETSNTLQPISRATVLASIVVTFRRLRKSALLPTKMHEFRMNPPLIASMLFFRVFASSKLSLLAME